MNRNVEVLTILFWVVGGLSALVALLFAGVGVLGGLGIIQPEDTPQERFGGAVGSALLFALLAGMAAGHIAVGTALRRLRPWARTGGLVLAVLDILCCCGAPLLTVLGVYALIVLLREDVRAQFAGP